MFILLQGSLSQSSSALDNVISPSSSPVSALGTILWEVSGENLSVKWGSPDTMTISISVLGKIWPSPSSIHASLLYSSWMFWPYFHLLNTSFSGLGSVRNSHCSQATLLTHLLIFLWIGMNQSWASRSCLERPANCARALCLGMLPPRESLCQFPEQAELCFHVEQVGDVAADSRLLGTCILPCDNHCSFHHKTAFFSWSFLLYPSFLLACPTHPWMNYPYQFWKFLDCLCPAMFLSKHVLGCSPAAQPLPALFQEVFPCWIQGFAMVPTGLFLPPALSLLKSKYFCFRGTWNALLAMATAFLHMHTNPAVSVPSKQLKWR